MSLSISKPPFCLLYTIFYRLKIAQDVGNTHAAKMRNVYGWWYFLLWRTVKIFAVITRNVLHNLIVSRCVNYLKHAKAFHCMAAVKRAFSSC